MIMKSLRDTTSPLSAREISRGPRGESIGLDLATVYRNLEVLERNGLVHQIHTGEGPGRYLLAGAEQCEYLVCDRCGAVEEVDPGELEDLRASIRRRFGYEVRFRRVPMVGKCRACLPSQESSPAGQTE
jgi:Fur family transcriptional regulator, ferric uptake regulator